MKQKINGIMYDTEAARKILVIAQDNARNESGALEDTYDEVLYRTENGFYFEAIKVRDDEYILPISQREALHLIFTRSVQHLETY
jgi:hypothetical protein